jgi:hypothetical protein
MSLSLPPTNPRRDRLIAIGCGALLFFWLRIEDNSTLPPVLAGLALTLVAAFLWLDGALGGKTLRLRYVFPGAALLGGISGLGTAAAAALLMLLKNGTHGHVFPDYPFGVIVEILRRAPLWALAGGLAVFGISLAWWALRDLGA